jgi:hypothetical protein
LERVLKHRDSGSTGAPAAHARSSQAVP